MPLFEQLTLSASHDTIVIQPKYTNGSNLPQTVVIDRATGDIRIDASVHIAESADETILPIHGILGVLNLHSPHLVVITGATKVGTLLSHNFYKITSTRIFPILKSRTALSDEDRRDEDRFLELLEGVLNEGYMWFSYTYDLTNNLQRTALENRKNDQGELWERADGRFFWNKYMQSKLINMVRSSSPDSPNYQLKNFILPIICGFVSISPCNIHSHAFTYVLISRKSVYRVGTRYHSRGIDPSGNVSNFAETEQIVAQSRETGVGKDSLGPRVMSFVQIRGSIPLYWRQKINAKYTPLLEVIDRPDTHETFKKHIQSTLEQYGDSQVLVNLINKKGYELPLGEAFKKQVEILNDERVKYTHFDFHHECRKMRWHRIQILLDQLEKQLKSQSYFDCFLPTSLATTASSCFATIPLVPVKVNTIQNGVIRTNCIDCLDRTNVVQSMFARRVLTIQLRELEVLRSDDTVEESGEFEKGFKNIWADNADAISTLYSGTGALKTDFTRTGKRTKLGLLKDGWNSVIRYVKNNYLDGERQDALDLLLGVYSVGATDGEESMKGEEETGLSHTERVRYVRINLDREMEMRNNVMFMTLTVPIVIITILTFDLLTTTSTFKFLQHFVIALAILLVFMKWVVNRYGTYLVSLPRLVKVEKVYSGEFVWKGAGEERGEFKKLA